MSATTDIQDDFEQFYRDFYHDEILTLANAFPNDQKSLVIDWQDLFEFDSDLADDFINHPHQMRQEAEQALETYDIPTNKDFSKAHVRITNCRNDKEIRELRSDDTNTLITIEGIVRNNTSVRPKICEAAWECQRCGTLNMIPQSTTELREPHECQGCERDGPFNVNYNQSEFIDSEALRIQESPEGLDGGETPQNIDTRLRDDIVGKVSPGDQVEITGVLQLKDKTGQDKSTTYDEYIQVHSLVSKDDKFEDFSLTQEEKQKIEDESDIPEIHTKFRDSIAPAIYGYPDEKLAIMLQQFGGFTKFLPDESRIRGDMHVLLIGDPGTGKSQLLQYIRNIAPRSVYASGKGTSAAGLCVTGDTRIHTTDGFVPIRDLATEHHPEPVSQDTSAPVNTNLYTYNTESDSIEKTNASHVWRMPEKECVKISSHDGKDLTVSRNTPLLSVTNSGTTWKDANNLSKGDVVALPAYSLDESERSMPDIFDYYQFTEERIGVSDEVVEHIRSNLSSQYGSLKEAAKEFDNTSAQSLYNLHRKRIKHGELSTLLEAVGKDLPSLDTIDATVRNGSEVSLPTTFTPELLYLLGLVFGDGDINVNTDKNKGYIRISNSDTDLLEHASDICESLFGKHPEIEYQDDRIPSIRLHSITVARLFKNLGMQSPKEDLELAPSITTASNVDHFVRGVMDADGWVSDRSDTDGGSSVGLNSISEDLVEQLQLIMETYGIQSRICTRDRKGSTNVINGTEVNSNHDQKQLEITGRDVDTYAEVFGFSIPEKAEKLDRICCSSRKKHTKWSRSHDVIADGGVDLPDTDDINWVVLNDVDDAGKQEVFDLTVPDTHNFFGNGFITHNTAAAVQTDMGEGSEWTLEAGTLVLADEGVAAIDELDKMDPDDRSALHEGLEQQEITVNKAGINATMKSRCALLAAANPKYGRFDEYESISEQIDLEPALISRFDLIFTVTDKPDQEKDTQLADHILDTNRAGQISTKKDKNMSVHASQTHEDDLTETADPEVDSDFFRKYIAYAKQNIFPEFTDEAQEHIRDFYVELRSKGEDEDSPVPVTARKLEALVRIAEASARVRLSNVATIEDAQRATSLAKSSLQDIGIDPETGEYDIDMVESSTSASQRNRIQSIKTIINELDDDDSDETGVDLDEVKKLAESTGMDASRVDNEIEKLKQKGEVYMPRRGRLDTA